MCQFCDNLKAKNYILPQRTTFACDNLCEVMTAKIERFGGVDCSLGTDCEECDGCLFENIRFELYAYDNRISVGYFHKIKEAVIAPYSESIDINFCPWCGKQITDNLVDFEKCCLGEPLKERK